MCKCDFCCKDPILPDYIGAYGQLCITEIDVLNFDSVGVPTYVFSKKGINIVKILMNSN